MRVNCVPDSRDSGNLNPATTYVIVARDGATTSYWDGVWWSDEAGAAIYHTRDEAEDALIDAQAVGEPDNLNPECVEIRVRQAGGCAAGGAA